jgi:hypothetical protein
MKEKIDPLSDSNFKILFGYSSLFCSYFLFFNKKLSCISVSKLLSSLIKTSSPFSNLELMDKFLVAEKKEML